MLRLEPPSSSGAGASSGTDYPREQLSVALGIGGGGGSRGSGAGGDGIGGGVGVGGDSSMLTGFQLDAACHNAAAERVRVVEHLIYNISPLCGKSEKHTPIYK